jgi:hypothetical protein
VSFTPRSCEKFIEAPRVLFLGRHRFPSFHLLPRTPTDPFPTNFTLFRFTQTLFHFPFFANFSSAEGLGIPPSPRGPFLTGGRNCRFLSRAVPRQFVTLPLCQRSCLSNRFRGFFPRVAIFVGHSTGMVSSTAISVGGLPLPGSESQNSWVTATIEPSSLCWASGFLYFISKKQVAIVDTSSKARGGTRALPSGSFASDNHGRSIFSTQSVAEASFRSSAVRRLRSD